MGDADELLAGGLFGLVEVGKRRVGAVPAVDLLVRLGRVEVVRGSGVERDHRWLALPGGVREHDRLVEGHVVAAGRGQPRAPRQHELGVAGRQRGLQLELDRAACLEERAGDAEVLAEAGERLGGGRDDVAVVVDRADGGPQAGVLERGQLQQLAHDRPAGQVDVVAEQQPGGRELLGQQAGEGLRHEAGRDDAEPFRPGRADRGRVDRQHVGCLLRHWGAPRDGPRAGPG